MKQRPRSIARSTTPRGITCASAPTANGSSPAPGTGRGSRSGRAKRRAGEGPANLRRRLCGVHPGRRWLVTGTSSEYRFWEVGSWQPGHRIPTNYEGGVPGNVAFSRDGTLMAIRHSSAVLHLIDPASGRRLAALESPDTEPDRRLLLQPRRQPPGRHRSSAFGPGLGPATDPAAVGGEGPGLGPAGVPAPPDRGPEADPDRVRPRRPDPRGSTGSNWKTAAGWRPSIRNAPRSPTNWPGSWRPAPFLRLAHPAQAVELAAKAIKKDPLNANYWKTLAVAHYRAEDLKASMEAFDKALELRLGGDACEWFFLAMIHQRQKHKGQVQVWYDRAVQWQESNQTAG